MHAPAADRSVLDGLEDQGLHREAELNLGQQFTEVGEHNRGSAESPMTYAELRAKFDDNASGFLSPEARTRLADEIQCLETLLVQLAT